jgi:L,D-peptidoglycan transpeptidase YkuD (ErfK/YbiS/YcfS/YnhG family)
MTIFVKNKHTLQIDEFKFRCCIGKNGSTIKKNEGDKKTPRGTFEIENLYFRKDRKEKPSTLLRCIEIKKDMGWCNDKRFSKKYNKLFKIEKKN